MCFVTDFLSESEREHSGGCVLVRRGNLLYTDRDCVGVINPGKLELELSEKMLL
jgi:hypothetical protein